MVDLERQRPIELLPGRDVATVVPWLLATPGVEVIARDRAGAYADAARTAAPAAQQVADRWHLLANLRDATGRLLVRCMPQMRQAAQEASEAMRLEAQPCELPAEPDSLIPVEMQKARQRDSGQRRVARLARYEEVLRRYRAGESIVSVSRTMNLDRRTVRGFVRAAVFPERMQRARTASLLDAHQQYLAARAAEGLSNAMQVWRELRARGFIGGHSRRARCVCKTSRRRA